MRTPLLYTTSLISRAWDDRRTWYPAGSIPWNGKTIDLYYSVVDPLLYPDASDSIQKDADPSLFCFTQIEDTQFLVSTESTLSDLYEAVEEENEDTITPLTAHPHPKISQQLQDLFLEHLHAASDEEAVDNAVADHVVTKRKLAIHISHDQQGNKRIRITNIENSESDDSDYADNSEDDYINLSSTEEKDSDIDAMDDWKDEEYLEKQEKLKHHNFNKQKKDRANATNQLTRSSEKNAKIPKQNTTAQPPLRPQQQSITTTLQSPFMTQWRRTQQQNTTAQPPSTPQQRTVTATPQAQFINQLLRTQQQNTTTQPPSTPQQRTITTTPQSPFINQLRHTQQQNTIAQTSLSRPKQEKGPQQTNDNVKQKLQQHLWARTGSVNKDSRPLENNLPSIQQDAPQPLSPGVMGGHNTSPIRVLTPTAPFTTLQSTAITQAPLSQSNNSSTPLSQAPFALLRSTATTTTVTEKLPLSYIRIREEICKQYQQRDERYQKKRGGAPYYHDVSRQNTVDQIFEKLRSEPSCTRHAIKRSLEQSQDKTLTSAPSIQKILEIATQSLSIPGYASVQMIEHAERPSLTFGTRNTTYRLTPKGEEIYRSYLNMQNAKKCVARSNTMFYQP